MTKVYTIHMQVPSERAFPLEKNTLCVKSIQQTVPCVTLLSECPTITTYAKSLLTARTGDAHLKGYVRLVCPLSDFVTCRAHSAGECA